MRLYRATNLKLALLLVLLLPLQAFAAVSGCGHVGATHAIQNHCEHASPNAMHHDCSACCCIPASSLSIENWLLPRFSQPPPVKARLESAPSFASERLDRPPRFRFT